MVEKEPVSLFCPKRLGTNAVRDAKGNPVQVSCLKGYCPSFRGVAAAHARYRELIDAAREALDAGRNDAAAQGVREAFAVLNGLDAISPQECHPTRDPNLYQPQKPVH